LWERYNSFNIILPVSIVQTRILTRTENKQRPKCLESRNPYVHIFPVAILNGIVQVLVTLVLIALLFIPVLVVSHLQGMGKRLIVILISSTVFITVLSVLGRVKVADLFIAGAT
jgi:hypothetical protein